MLLQKLQGAIFCATHCIQLHHNNNFLHIHMHTIHCHSLAYQQSAGFSTHQMNICRTIITGITQHREQLYYSCQIQWFPTSQLMHHFCHVRMSFPLPKTVRNKSCILSNMGCHAMKHCIILVELCHTDRLHYVLYGI